MRRAQNLGSSGVEGGWEGGVDVVRERRLGSDYSRAKQSKAEHSRAGHKTSGPEQVEQRTTTALSALTSLGTGSCQTSHPWPSRPARPSPRGAVRRTHARQKRTLPSSPTRQRRHRLARKSVGRWTRAGAALVGVGVGVGVGVEVRVESSRVVVVAVSAVVWVGASTEQSRTEQNKIEPSKADEHGHRRAAHPLHSHVLSLHPHTPHPSTQSWEHSSHPPSRDAK